MTDGRVPLEELTVRRPFALVFGDEAAGLPDRFHEFGTSVRIMHTTGIDSLNLATAVGITLYHVWEHGRPYYETGP